MTRSMLGAVGTLVLSIVVFGLVVAFTAVIDRGERNGGLLHLARSAKLP